MGELPNDARVECGKHNAQTLTVQPSLFEMCYLCVIHFDDFFFFWSLSVRMHVLNRDVHMLNWRSRDTYKHSEL